MTAESKGEYDYTELSREHVNGHVVFKGIMLPIYHIGHKYMCMLHSVHNYCRNSSGNNVFTSMTARI